LINAREIPGDNRLLEMLLGARRWCAEAAREAYKKFRQNPAHSSLRLERLRSDPRFWSVRVTRDYRAVAQRFEGDVWIWAWIGSHKDFDRQFPK
jgi:hypothetical protein